MMSLGSVELRKRLWRN